MNEVVVVVTVHLAGHEIEPLQAVELPHQVSLDLLFLIGRKGPDLLKGQSFFCRRLPVFVDQPPRFRAGSLIHVEPENALARACRVLHDHAAHAERLRSLP